MKILRPLPLTSVVLATALMVLAGCSGSNDGQSADPDEAFLDQVRQEASTAPASEEDTAPLVSPNAAAAKVELQTATFEMGEIANDTIAVKRMKVYNRGEAPLKITRVSTSCGCTTGEMEQSLIPPGGEGDLIIRVDPNRIPGFYADKVLTLFTNDPVNPTPTVHVVTHVQAEFVVVPETIDFGEVALGSGAEASVRVRQLQQAPFEINNASLNRNATYLQTELEKLPKDQWADPDKAEYRVTARVSPDAPAGPIDKWIILDTNLTRYTRVPVRVTGTVVGPYMVTPRNVMVRGLEPGTPQRGVLVLSSDKTLNVAEVTNENDAVDVSFRAAEKPNTYLFDIDVPTRTPSRGLRDTWTIAFSIDGKDYEESVPVSVVLTREN